MNAPLTLIPVLLWASLATVNAACRAEKPLADAPDASGPQAAEPKAAEWLARLEARGRQIESLRADVVLEKLQPLLDDRQTRFGGIDYLAADPQQDRAARFAVRFDKLVVNSALRERPLEYIFDGSWLVEKNHERKLFIKRQVVPPGEVLDPLQIDGPFPIPLGQKREEVLARFDVEVVDPPRGADELSHDLTEPPLHLRLTPRADAAGPAGRRFREVDIWFDRGRLLPLKVHTVDETGAETTIVLTNLKVNTLNENDIAGRFDTDSPPPGGGWDVEIIPWREAP